MPGKDAQFAELRTLVKANAKAIDRNTKLLEANEKRWKENDERWKRNDEKFERLIALAVANQHRFNDMVTKKEFNSFKDDVNARFDRVMAELERGSQERLMILAQMRRFHPGMDVAS